MGLAGKKVSSKKRQGSTSARKGAAPALSKEYQAIFKNTGKPMVIVEEDATISLANDEFEKLSGYTKEEIEGKKSWTEFVARGDRRRVKDYHHLRRSDSMLASRCFEFRFLDRQGKTKNIVLTIGTIPGTKKSMASLLDVTDRRQEEETVQIDKKALEDRVESQMTELVKTNEALQAEIADLKREIETLRAIEERYRTLVENVDFGINLIDADHNVIMTNAALGRQFNKSVNEMIRKKCFQVFEKRDAICPHCPGVQTMATGKSAEVETQGVRDDGSRYHARIKTFPAFGHDGTVTGFIEVVEDITERKQIENALLQSQQELKALMDASPIAISWADLQGNILYINRKHHELFGYTREEIPTIAEWQRQADKDPAQRKRFDLWMKKVYEAQKHGRPMPPPQEMTATCKDGSIRYVTVVVTVVSNRILAIHNDITERKLMEEELRESEERFRILAEHAPLGISIMAPDRSFEYLNPRFTEIFGYTIEDIPDKDTWFEKAYPDEAYRKELIATWKRDTAEALKIGKENPRVFTVRCKNGQDKIIDFRRIDLKDGKQYQIYDDITVRTKAEEALRESEERYRSLVENIDLGINLIDSDYNILMVNAALSKRLKKTARELIGEKCFREFAKLDAVCPHCPGVQTMATGKPAEAETEVMRDEGVRFQMRLQSFPLFGDDGTVSAFIEIVEDLTERKRMEKIEYMATHDFLTGLPNRILFNDRLTMALAQARRHQQTLCVMLLDLDYFKNINDTLGHSVGDKLLRIVGERLTGLLRTSDTIARMGGDEFLLLLTEISGVENVTAIAQKILESFREPFAVDSRELMITTSIGIAVFPDDGEDADTLVKNADIAMYSAKERGRDNFQRYTPT